MQDLPDTVPCTAKRLHNGRPCGECDICQKAPQEPYCYMWGVCDPPEPAARPAVIQISTFRPKRKSLVGKAASYMAAFGRWALSGFRARSRRRVAEIMAICNACSYLKDGSCTLCGCHVSNHTPTVINKARMGTEICPANPPKWT